MEISQANYKVEIDLNINYRVKEGISQEDFDECLAEAIKEYIETYKNGGAFIVNNIKLTKI